MNEKHYRKLERMYASAPIHDYYLPTLTVSHGADEVSIEVRADMCRAAATVNRHVYFRLHDYAAFFADNSQVGDRFL